MCRWVEEQNTFINIQKNSTSDKIAVKLYFLQMLRNKWSSDAVAPDWVDYAWPLWGPYRAGFYWQFSYMSRPDCEWSRFGVPISDHLSPYHHRHHSKRRQGYNRNKKLLAWFHYQNANSWRIVRCVPKWGHILNGMQFPLKQTFSNSLHRCLSVP